MPRPLPCQVISGYRPGVRTLAVNVSCSGRRLCDIRVFWVINFSRIPLHEHANIHECKPFQTLLLPRIVAFAFPIPCVTVVPSYSTWTMATPTSPLIVSIITLGLAWLGPVSAFVPTSATHPLQVRRELVRSAGTAGVNRVYQQQERCRASDTSTVKMAGDSVAEVKSKILQLAAVMDRGGMANPGKKT